MCVIFGVCKWWITRLPTYVSKWMWPRQGWVQWGWYMKPAAIMQKIIEFKKGILQRRSKVYWATFLLTCTVPPSLHFEVRLNFTTIWNPLAPLSTSACRDLAKRIPNTSIVDLRIHSDLINGSRCILNDRVHRYLCHQYLQQQITIYDIQKHTYTKNAHYDFAKMFIVIEFPAYVHLVHILLHMCSLLCIFWAPASPLHLLTALRRMYWVRCRMSSTT